ncbi:MAG: hypothetical protein QOH08_2508 [Chloroflexota bacterium]|nr:hypothetical protein [Chloroflexota bacterium]
MPAELATSLSILAGWQGLTDATVRGLALTAAAPLGFSFTVESHGDTVSVTFRRPRPYGP